MIWVVAAVLVFLVVAGVRLLASKTPAEGTAESAAEPAGPEVVVGEDEETAVRIVLAGRGRRFVARLIDAFVVVGLTVTASIVIAALASAGTQIGRLRWTVFVVSIITGGAVEVGFIGTTGQTPGKMAMGVQVVALDTGRPPGYGAAFARWVLPAILGAVVPVALDRDYLRGTGGLPSSSPALIAYAVAVLIYAWALWDPARQGIHDKIAGTLVAAKP